jgi:hypothetical protein
MKREVTKSIKVKWLSSMFYGVSHASDFNINPYKDIATFLNSRVGNLGWGNDRNEAKERFSNKFFSLLDAYGINLPMQYIKAELNEENQLNIRAIEHWAEHSVFPAGW